MQPRLWGASPTPSSAGLARARSLRMLSIWRPSPTNPQTTPLPLGQGGASSTAPGDWMLRSRPRASRFAPPSTPPRRQALAEAITSRSARQRAPEPRVQAPPLLPAPPRPWPLSHCSAPGGSAAGHPRSAAMEIPGSLCKKVKLSNNAQNWVSGGLRPERGRLWAPRTAGASCRSRGRGPGQRRPVTASSGPELSPRLERRRAAVEADEGASARSWFSWLCR